MEIKEHQSYYIKLIATLISSIIISLFSEDFIDMAAQFFNPDYIIERNLLEKLGQTSMMKTLAYGRMCFGMKVFDDDKWVVNDSVARYKEGRFRLTNKGSLRVKFFYRPVPTVPNDYVSNYDEWVNNNFGFYYDQKTVKTYKFSREQIDGLWAFICNADIVENNEIVRIRMYTIRVSDQVVLHISTRFKLELNDDKTVDLSENGTNKILDRRLNELIESIIFDEEGLKKKQWNLWSWGERLNSFFSNQHEISKCPVETPIWEKSVKKVIDEK